MQANAVVKAEEMEPADKGAPTAAIVHDIAVADPSQPAPGTGRKANLHDVEQEGQVPAGAKMLDVGMYWRPNVITRSATRSWSGSAPAGKRRPKGLKSSASSPRTGKATKSVTVASESDDASSGSEDGSEENNEDNEVGDSSNSADPNSSSSSTYTESSSELSDDSIKKRKRPCRKQPSQRVAPVNKTGRLTGVYEQGGRFRAQYCHQGLVHQLGMYVTEAAAGQAWDRVAWTYRGKQATLNFPHLVNEYDTEESKRTVRELMDERMSLYKDRGKPGKNPVVLSNKKKTSTRSNPEPPPSRRGATRKVAKSFIPPVDNFPEPGQASRKRKRQASDSEDTSSSEDSSTVSSSSDECASDSEPTQPTNTADSASIDNQSTENEKKSTGKQARGNGKVKPKQTLMAAQQRLDERTDARVGPDNASKAKQAARKPAAKLQARTTAISGASPSVARPNARRRSATVSNKAVPMGPDTSTPAQRNAIAPVVGVQSADKVASKQIMLNGAVVSSTEKATPLQAQKVTAPGIATTTGTPTENIIIIDNGIVGTGSCMRKSLATPGCDQPNSGLGTPNVTGSARPQRSRRPPKAFDPTDYDSSLPTGVLPREHMHATPMTVDTRAMNSKPSKQVQEVAQPKAAAHTATKRTMKARPVVEHEPVQESVAASIVPELLKDVGKLAKNIPAGKPDNGLADDVDAKKPGAAGCISEQDHLTALCNDACQNTHEAGVDGGEPRQNVHKTAVPHHGHHKVEASMEGVEDAVIETVDSELTMRRSARRPVRSTRGYDVSAPGTARPVTKKKVTKSKQIEPTARLMSLPVLTENLLAQLSTAQDALQQAMASWSGPACPVPQTSAAGVQPASTKPQASSDSSPNASLRPLSRWRKRRGANGSPPGETQRAGTHAVRAAGMDSNLGDSVMHDTCEVATRDDYNLAVPTQEVKEDVLKKRPTSKRQRTERHFPSETTAAELARRHLEPHPSSAIRNSLPSVHTAPVSSLMKKQPEANGKLTQRRAGEATNSSGIPCSSAAATSVKDQANIQQAQSIGTAATTHVQMAAKPDSLTGRLVKNIKATTSNVKRVRYADMPIVLSDTACDHPSKASRQPNDADVHLRQAQQLAQTAVSFGSKARTGTLNFENRSLPIADLQNDVLQQQQQQQLQEVEPDDVMYATATITTFVRTATGAKPSHKNELTPDSERTISNIPSQSMHAVPSNGLPERDRSALSGSVSKACKPATLSGGNAFENSSCATLDLSKPDATMSKPRRTLHFTSPPQPGSHSFGHHVHDNKWQHTPVQGMPMQDGMLSQYSGNLPVITTTCNGMVYGSASHMPYGQVHPIQVYTPGPATHCGAQGGHHLHNLPAPPSFGMMPGGPVGGALQIMDAASARNAHVLAHLQQLRMMQDMEKQQIQQMHYDQMQMMQHAANVQQLRHGHAGYAHITNNGVEDRNAVASAMQASQSAQGYMCDPTPMPNGQTHMYYPTMHAGAASLHAASAPHYMANPETAAMYQQQVGFQNHPVSQSTLSNIPQNRKTGSKNGGKLGTQAGKAELPNPDPPVPSPLSSDVRQPTNAAASNAGQPCNVASRRGLGLSRNSETHAHQAAAGSKGKCLNISQTPENDRDLSYHASKDNTRHGRSSSSYRQPAPSPARLADLDQLADVAVMLQSQEQPEGHEEEEQPVKHAAKIDVHAAVGGKVSGNSSGLEKPVDDVLNTTVMQHGIKISQTVSGDTKHGRADDVDQGDHPSVHPNYVSFNIVSGSHEIGTAANKAALHFPKPVSTGKIAVRNAYPDQHAAREYKHDQPTSLVTPIAQIETAEKRSDTDTPASETAHAVDTAKKASTVGSDVLIVNKTSGARVHADFATPTEVTWHNMLPASDPQLGTNNQKNPAVPCAQKGSCHNNTNELAQQSQPLTQSSPKTQPTDNVVERQLRTPATHDLQTPATFAINGLHGEHNVISGNGVARFIQMLHSSSEPSSSRNMPVIFKSNGSATTSSHPGSLQGILQLLSSPQVLLSEELSPVPVTTAKPSPVGHPNVAMDISMPNWSQI